MEVNIARIARDLHNKTYTNVLELDSFLEMEKATEQETGAEISNKLKVLKNMVKRVGK